MVFPSVFFCFYVCNRSVKKYNFFQPEAESQKLEALIGNNQALSFMLGALC